MIVNGVLTVVCIRNYFVEEFDVPGLCNICGDRIEEPLAVIGSELSLLRALLVSGIVSQLDERHCASAEGLT